MFYTFNAYRNTNCYTAEDIANQRAVQYTESGDDMVAMALANSDLLWSNPQAKEGRWEIACEISNTYQWVEYNSHKLLSGGYLY